MLESFYVDNLVAGERNSTDAFNLYETSRQLMAAGGFRLRKWLTNDKALRDRIEQSEENESATDRNDEEETFAKIALGSGSEIKKGCERVLGLPWDLERDSIPFSFEKVVERAREMQATKGTLLSLLQWNLDLTKSLGTGQICSLNGGFVISRFFSIHFIVTLAGTKKLYRSLYRGLR